MKLSPSVQVSRPATGAPHISPTIRQPGDASEANGSVWVKRVRAAKVTGKIMSIEEFNKTGVVIVGSREKLAAYRDLAGFNTSLTKTQFGTLPDEMCRANMIAIAEEILPHFRNRLPQGKPQAAAE